MQEKSDGEEARTALSPAARPGREESGRIPLQDVSHEAMLFGSALHQIEENGNVEIMASLFAENAALWRQTFEEPYRGLIGARRFWKEYLDQFEVIHSRFIEATERSGLLLLEWYSTGLTHTHRPIHYRGISIVEWNSERKIMLFKTYFDSAPFLFPQQENH